MEGPVVYAACVWAEGSPRVFKTDAPHTCTAFRELATAFAWTARSPMPQNIEHVAVQTAHPIGDESYVTCYSAFIKIGGALDVMITPDRAAALDWRRLWFSHGFAVGYALERNLKV